MKRAAFWTASVGLLLGFCWIGAWFVFKYDFEATLDREEATLTARGSTIGYDKRTISGFPLQYRVNYTNLTMSQANRSSVLQITAPTALAIASLTDTTKLEVQFPPVLRMTEIPLFEGTKRTAEINSENLVLALSREKKALNYTVFARELSMSRPSDDESVQGNLFNLGLRNLIATGTADTEVGLLDSHIRAAKAQITVAGELIGAPGLWQDVELSDIDMNLRTNLSRSADFQADLASGDGVVDMTIVMGGAESSMLRDGELMATLKSEAAESDIIISDGLISAGLRTRGIEIATPLLDLEPAAALLAQSADLKYITPVLNITGDSVYDLSAKVADVTLGDSVWEAFDPAGTLEKKSSSAIIAGRFQYPEQLPAALSGLTIDEKIALTLSNATVELRELHLATLGSQIDASGDLALTNEGPDGKFDITLTGVQNLMTDLASLQLLPTAYYETALGILDIFSAPVSDDVDQRVSALEIKPEGFYVNGSLLQ